MTDQRITDPGSAPFIRAAPAERFAHWSSACAAALRAALGRLQAPASSPAEAAQPAITESARGQTSPQPAGPDDVMNVVTGSVAHGYEEALRRIDATHGELERLRRDLEAVIDPALLHATRTTPPDAAAACPFTAARAAAARSAA
jgi:hypothetical protein